MAKQSKVSTNPTQLAPARFQKSVPLLLAGLRRHFNRDTRTQIPDLWHEAGPQFAKLPGHVGNVAYGVCISTPGDQDDFDYLAAVEVSGVQKLPPGWTHIKVPAQRYAVFRHDGPVSDIPTLMREIFQSWLPNSGYELTAGGDDEPDFLEHYGEGYDPTTGLGDIEVWLPVKS